MDRVEYWAHGDTGFDQRSFGELQRAFERFRDGVSGACLVELRRMAGIAGACENRRVGKLQAQLANDTLGCDRLVHGDDARGGFIGAKPEQRIAASCVAVSYLVAELATVADKVGGAVDNPVGLAVSGKQDRKSTRLNSSH